MSKIYKYRFLIARRFTQISIISLFIAGNIYGIFILKGNISSSIVLDSVVLSDPFALLQMFVAGVSLSSDIIIGAFIVLLFYSLIKPRSFCSWVCPVNIITDSANYLRRKLKIKTLNSVMPLSKNIKYYFIAIILVVSFFLHIAVFELISPISMIYRDIVFSLSLPFWFCFEFVFV